MSAVGLIIGNGYAKAWCDGRQTRFPAVAAPWSPTSYASVTGGGPVPITVEGAGAWLVGEEAQTFARERVVSILDKSRYSDPSFVALARAALQHVAPSQVETILTGMPAAWFADRAAQAALHEAIARAAAPWGTPSITIAPEAAGVYYAYVFENGRLNLERTRGAVGVIDAGYRDVNVALFDRGRYVASESIPGGAVAALRSIKRLIAATYGLELSEIEVDAAVRDGSVRVGGQLQPLPRSAADELLKGVSAVEGVARSLWPSGGAALDVVVLGGGGAVTLGPALSVAFPQLVVPGTDIRSWEPSSVAASNEAWWEQHHQAARK